MLTTWEDEENGGGLGDSEAKWCVCVSCYMLKHILEI